MCRVISSVVVISSYLSSYVSLITHTAKNDIFLGFISSTFKNNKTSDSITTKHCRCIPNQLTESLHSERLIRHVCGIPRYSKETRITPYLIEGITCKEY